MKSLYESIFDVDNNIDAVGYEATHCGKRGIGRKYVEYDQNKRG